jgi:hypothetical protein
LSGGAIRRKTRRSDADRMVILKVYDENNMKNIFIKNKQFLLKHWKPEKI